jgi:hypothetical protein
MRKGKKTELFSGDEYDEWIGENADIFESFVALCTFSQQALRGLLNSMAC